MDQFDITDTFTLNETVKMFFDNKTAHFTGCRNSESGLAVFCFDFNNQRAKNVNAK
ncbi:Uncharacterised protein [Shigella sonnei]|nr:Uncharacterised protein [Shigella sonnei]CSQ35262.1 Uncharacterised protein [Shigella sonnei]CSW38807.1 Uncharacterised protein [Shigella sonnei]CSY82407.1 Uncharacterised protein [Shigella sonnei]CSZ97884.1 Uncharacterised protein [Shigella sonnei]